MEVNSQSGQNNKGKEHEMAFVVFCRTEDGNG